MDPQAKRTRVVSTKNLFDDVFDCIPADVSLDFGASSLKEELALVAAGLAPRGGATRASTTAGGGGGGNIKGSGSSAIIMRSALDEGDDDYDNELFSADNSGTERPASSTATTLPAAGPLFARLAPSSLEVHGSSRARAGGAGGSGGDSGSSSSGGGFTIAMDEQDAAVIEATKYATYVAQVRAQEHADQQKRLEDEGRSVAAGVVRDDDLGGSAGVASVSVSGSNVAAARASQPSHATRGWRGKDRQGGVSAGTVDEQQQQQQPQPASRDRQQQQRADITAEEQLMLMPPGLSTLYNGQCAMFRHRKGFGFISPDVGGPDVYFTGDNVVYTFTRLALKQYYESRQEPVPACVLRGLPPMEDEAEETSSSSAAAAAVEGEREGEEGRQKSNAVAQTEGGSVKDEETSVNTSGVLHQGEPHQQDGTSEKAGAAVLASKTEACDEVQTGASHTAEKAEEDNDEEEEDQQLHPKQQQQQRHSSDGVLGDGTAVLAMQDGEGDADVPSAKTVPRITRAEVELAVKAATLLTPAFAQLLVWQLECGLTSSACLAHTHGDPNSHHGGGGCVTFRDRVTFTVHRNRAVRVGSSRLLRAEHIRGPQECGYATAVEQAWFCGLFPHAIGFKAEGDRGERRLKQSGAGSHRGGGDRDRGAEGGDQQQQHQGRTADGENASEAAPPGEEGGASTAEQLEESSMKGCGIVRYTGTVRTYDCDEQRGYIHPDERQTIDVLFFSDTVVWDAAHPAPRRTVTERMRVNYSVCSKENNKYVATLITSAKDDRPMKSDNIVLAEEFTSERTGRRGGGMGGQRNAGGGQNAGGDGVERSHGAAEERKRQREEEEELLLFDDADYNMM